MSQIRSYMEVMDRWEVAAFLPYLFAPILLSMLLISFLAVENGIVPALYLIPVLLLGFYNFYQIYKGTFATDGIQYLVSGGTILYTLFIPYLLIQTNISADNFTLIYIVLVLPTFLGHVYSVIYQITRNLSEGRRALVVKK